MSRTTITTIAILAIITLVIISFEIFPARETAGNITAEQEIQMQVNLYKGEQSIICSGIASRDFAICGQLDETKIDACTFGVKWAMGEYSSPELCSQLIESPLGYFMCLASTSGKEGLCEKVNIPDCTLFASALFDEITDEELISRAPQDFSLSNYYFYKAVIRKDKSICENIPNDQSLEYLMSGDADNGRQICKAFFGENECSQI